VKIVNKQIRTCISCRNKFNQNKLLRLQCINKQLVIFSGENRSFYLCEQCILSQTNIVKALYRQCKNKAEYGTQLKEIVRVWQKIK
jgi:predicted RNA-binding protein YlxR (DUF448 family)